jgi:hypothetical protein
MNCFRYRFVASRKHTTLHYTTLHYTTLHPEPVREIKWKIWLNTGRIVGKGHTACWFLFFIPLLYAFSQNCEKRLSTSSCLSVCLSVCPRETTRLRLEGFSFYLYFMLEDVSKFNFSSNLIRTTVLLWRHMDIFILRGRFNK